jgi:hypothetical protein
MDFKKLLWDWIPNAEWDLFKWVIGKVAWASMVAALAGVIQKIRNGVLDWWVLGAVFVASVFSLYLTSDGLRFMTTPVVDTSPASSPVASSPVPPVSSGLTDAQIQQLRFVSLGLPRPCFVKVTAAPENMWLRKSFLEIFNTTHLNSLQERHQTLIPGCEINGDEKDMHPELYIEELSRMSQGMIVVNGDDKEMVRALVEELRMITNLRVRPGTTRPLDIADTWIHIQIGAGSLQR